MAEHLTRHSCLSCSKVQHTCCTFHEHYIPLTIADIQRIERTGHQLEDFATVVAFDEGQLEDDEEWWRESMVRIDGYSWRVCLKSQGKSTCVMLKDEKGCVLGGQRPFICRIYPFWVEEGRVQFQDDFCYLHKQGVAREEVLSLMGESEQDILEHFQAMKEDFVKNKDQHEVLVKRLLYRRFLFGESDLER